MSNEIETKQNPQEQAKHATTGPVGTVDPKTNPSKGNQNQGNSPQDGKKNPMQDSDSQHKGQEKSADEKRRAS